MGVSIKRIQVALVNHLNSLKHTEKRRLFLQGEELGMTKKNNASEYEKIRNSKRFKQLSDKELKEFLATKNSLGIYRELMWSVKERFDDVEKESSYVLGSETLAEMLDGLDDYATIVDKKRLEERIYSLQKTKSYVSTIDFNLQKLKSYPKHGKVYFDILYHRYISPEIFTDTQVWEMVDHERSTYFERKFDAILLLSVLMWGGNIPKVKHYRK